MAGLNPRHLPEAIPTGPGLRRPQRHEVQVALLDRGPRRSGPGGRLSKPGPPGDGARRAGRRRPRPDPIAVLPAHVEPGGAGSSATVGTGRPAGRPGRGRRRPARTAQWSTSAGTGRVPGRRAAPVGPEQHPGGHGPHRRPGGLPVVAVTARPSAADRPPRGPPGVVAVVDGRTVPKADLEALLMEAGGQGSARAGGQGSARAGDRAGEGGGQGSAKPGRGQVPRGRTPPSPSCRRRRAAVRQPRSAEPLSGFLRWPRDRASALIVGGTTSELGGLPGLHPRGPQVPRRAAAVPQRTGRRRVCSGPGCRGRPSSPAPRAGGRSSPNGTCSCAGPFRRPGPASG